MRLRPRAASGNSPDEPPGCRLKTGLVAWIQIPKMGAKFLKSRLFLKVANLMSKYLIINHLQMPKKFMAPSLVNPDEAR